MAIESGNLTCLNLLLGMKLKNLDDLKSTYPKFHPIHSAVRSGNVDIVD